MRLARAATALVCLFLAFFKVGNVRWFSVPLLLFIAVMMIELRVQQAALKARE